MKRLSIAGCGPSRAGVPLLALALLLGACRPPAPADPSSHAGAESPVRPMSTGVEAADPQAPTGGRNAARWLDAPYVVLVSLDGFAARYMQQHRPETLGRLARRGVWASDGMIPSYPTKTYVNHYTVATGLHPARHGLVANTFYDEHFDAVYRLSDREKVQDGRWYSGEPMWVTAEQQGMVAASFFFPGSEADIAGVRPSHWRAYDGAVPNRERIDQVLDWLAAPAEHRPHVITTYFSDTDDAGHAHGPDSPEVADAVARLDADLAYLAEGIARLGHGEQVSLIITSDHGMDAFPAEHVQFIADHLPDMKGIRVPESGPHANVFVDGGPERVLEVYRALSRGLEHASVFLADDTPERLAYRDNPRIGDIVILPDSGWVVQPAGFERKGGFTHGWDNTNLAMRALFVAAGPRLRAGSRIAPFANVDVYPLVIELLGLDPAADIDGTLDTWRDVLRDRPTPADPTRRPARRP